MQDLSLSVKLSNKVLDILSNISVFILALVRLVQKWMYFVISLTDSSINSFKYLSKLYMIIIVCKYVYSVLLKHRLLLLSLILLSQIALLFLYLSFANNSTVSSENRYNLVKISPFANSTADSHEPVNLLIITLLPNGLYGLSSQVALESWSILKDENKTNIDILAISNTPVERENVKYLPYSDLSNSLELSRLKQNSSFFFSDLNQMINLKPYTHLLLIQEGVITTGFPKHLFKEKYWDVLSGIALDCSLSTNKKAETNDRLSLEMESKQCEWESIARSSYILIKTNKLLNAIDIPGFVEVSFRKNTFIDLSPTWMPLILNSPNKNLASHKQAGNGFQFLINEMPIASISMKLCPYLNNTYHIVNFTKEENLMRLYWMLSASPSTWLSPYKQGVEAHATRLGCFGFSKASELVKTEILLAKDDISLVAANKLELAKNYEEIDPDYTKIGERIFPFKVIKLDCEKLWRRCFVHVNGTLLEAEDYFLEKFRPIILDYLRSYDKFNPYTFKPDFVACFNGLDAYRVQMSVVAERSKSKHLPILPIPQFHNSICDKNRSYRPNNTDTGYSSYANYSNFLGTASFLDFDHTFTSAGKRTRKTLSNKHNCTISFENKHKLVIFRGTPNGLLPSKTCKRRYECKKYQYLERAIAAKYGPSRIGLVMWSMLRPFLVNARLSGLGVQQSWTLFQDKDIERLFHYFPISSEDYYCKYQQVIVMQGIGAAFRMVNHFKAQQLIYLQHGDCFQWYYRYLKPWIHYVPFSYDLSDLERNIMIVRSSPELARMIAFNGRRFYDKYLSWDAITKISSYIFEKIGKITLFPEGKCVKQFPFRVALRAPKYNNLISCENIDIANKVCRRDVRHINGDPNPSKNETEDDDL